MSQQPIWKFIANLGDASPLEHGGYFVREDTTGVYAPEAVLLEPPCDDVDLDSPEARWTAWQFVLEPCTYQDGILSDNKFHPDYPAWFAKPESNRATRPQDTTYLSNVAECSGMPVAVLQSFLCSADPLRRAEAYQAIGSYHGFNNLDEYPERYTKSEAQALIARLTA